MDALRRFEEWIEAAIEDGLAATAGRLHPVQFAKKLARFLDTEQTIAAGKVLVPNDYTIGLAPADFAALAEFRLSLQRELAAYLSSLARERGLSFVAAPQVNIVQDVDMKPPRFRASARIVEITALPPSQDGGSADFGAEATAPLPVGRVQAALRPRAQVILPDGRAVPLDKAVVSLGRALENDVVLEDRRVSRHHAQIRFLHKTFCIYDLASANGTLVNGQPASQTVLRDGDRISLGGVEVVFRAAPQESSRGT